MRRKYDLRKIVTKRSYDASELAETLGVHLQTIRQWHRDGLKALPDTKSPYLFLGSEVKVFLKAEAEKHKTPLRDGEFYCLSCRKGVKPDPQTIEIKERKQKLGNGAQAIYLKSKCPECSRTVMLFSSRAKLKEQEIARMPPKSASQTEPSKQVGKKQKPPEPMEGQRTLFD